MTVDAVTVASTFFQPIRVTEAILEGLIRTAAPALFPRLRLLRFPASDPVWGGDSASRRRALAADDPPGGCGRSSSIRQ